MAEGFTGGVSEYTERKPERELAAAVLAWEHLG
jgi:hypothetical protein